MKSVRSAVLATTYTDAPPANHPAARVRNFVAVPIGPLPPFTYVLLCYQLLPTLLCSLSLSLWFSSLSLLGASCCYITCCRYLAPAAAHALQVFQAEYNLMCDIVSCPVPYVSLCDGIWMGLGVGLAVHGDVRSAGTTMVATEDQHQQFIGVLEGCMKHGAWCLALWPSA